MCFQCALSILLYAISSMNSFPMLSLLLHWTKDRALSRIGHTRRKKVSAQIVYLWHLHILLLAYLLAFYLAYLMAFYLAYLLSSSWWKLHRYQPIPFASNPFISCRLPWKTNTPRHVGDHLNHSCHVGCSTAWKSNMPGPGGNHLNQWWNMSDRMPEDMQDRTSDRMLNVMPEVMLDKCQVCQLE